MEDGFDLFHLPGRMYQYSTLALPVRDVGHTSRIPSMRTNSKIVMASILYLVLRSHGLQFS